MKNYSLGVFINIVNNNTDDWRKQSSFIHTLENVEHVEILLEEVSLNDKEITLLQELLEDYRIIVHAPFVDITLLSPHEEITKASLEVLTRGLQISNKLNARLFTVHPESYPFFWDENKAINSLLQNIEKLSSKSSIPIGIENLSISGTTRITYPSNPKHLDILAKCLPENVGFTIDIGHFLKDEYDVLDIINARIEQIQNVHLHDGNKKGSHYKLGDGNLPIKEFLALLTKKNYSKFVTLEVVGKKNIEESWNLLQSLLRENSS